MTLVLAGLLVRSGIFPLHCWLPDLFARSSFGFALSFAAPLPGLYGIVRLVLPTAPESLLEVMEIATLATATYAAGMATIQTQPRRLFAHLCLSQSSLVFVGLEMETTIGLTGSLCLWYSVCLALGGLGLTLRAIQARFGRLDLKAFQGLYEQAPASAVACLMTGLGSVGFPGTIGFIAADLLVDGAVKENLWLGLIVVSAMTSTGIAVVRMYSLIFTGRWHASAIPMGIRPRERWAVLTLTVLIMGVGSFPQYGVRSRHEAAERIHRTSAATATQRPPDPIAERPAGPEPVKGEEQPPATWGPGPIGSRSRESGFGNNRTPPHPVREVRATVCCVVSETALTVEAAGEKRGPQMPLESGTSAFGFECCRLPERTRRNRPQMLRGPAFASDTFRSGNGSESSFRPTCRSPSRVVHFLATPLWDFPTRPPLHPKRRERSDPEPRSPTFDRSSRPTGGVSSAGSIPAAQAFREVRTVRSDTPSARTGNSRLALHRSYGVGTR